MDKAELAKQARLIAKKMRYEEDHGDKTSGYSGDSFHPFALWYEQVAQALED